MNRFVFVGLLLGNALTVFGFPATLAPKANDIPGIPEREILVVDKGDNATLPKPTNENTGTIDIDLSGGKVVQKRDTDQGHNERETWDVEYPVEGEGRSVEPMEYPVEQGLYFDTVDGEVDMLKSVIKQLALVPKDEKLTMTEIDNYFFGDKSDESSVETTPPYFDLPDGIDWGVENVVKQGSLIERAKTLFHYIKAAADLLHEHQDTLRAAYDNAVRIKGVLDTFLSLWG
uniref:Conserved secreted protein n=1 Tax=Panagrellus redivivus TaxID=6233 RepID=A0A7E4V9T9_PANRE